jgi:hypothetical protein
MNDLAVFEGIERLIYVIRGKRVMLDRNLSDLYEIETRVLKQAVRRNIRRFPQDFMFELTHEENHRLRSQNVILKRGQHSKYAPMVFTEQGVAMLSSVLNSERAIQVNIQIMRVFTKLRQHLLDNNELRTEIEKLKVDTDGKFRIVFETLDQLLSFEGHQKKKIGYIKEEISQYKT